MCSQVTSSCWSKENIELIYRNLKYKNKEISLARYKFLFIHISNVKSMQPFRRGIDQIHLRRAFDQIHLRRGIDQIHLRRGIDQIHLRRGIDQIHLRRGIDQIYLRRSIDQIHLRWGIDQIHLRRAFDQIHIRRAFDQIDLRRASIKYKRVTVQRRATKMIAGISNRNYLQSAVQVAETH